MAKSKKNLTDSVKVERKLVNITPSQAASIANALSSAYGVKDAMGATLTNAMCSKIVPMIPKGNARLSPESLDVVMDKLQQARKWSKETTYSRRSEIKVILSAARGLSPAVNAFTKANAGICGWNSVVGLARKLDSGMDQETAVDAQIEGKSGSTISDKIGANKWVATRLKGVVNAECVKFMRPAGFVKALRILAADYDVII